ncbi:trypsin Blo t 3-like [Lasioglossum baleicum]|uniref:trypsin Blo t 3-like n=1 Tax=Lasioglossum baleicum TaxID=434251 RepID=UPI003FCD59FE
MFTICELESRIINGTVAKPGQIPYQVSLQSVFSSSHFCGGSILNADYVITAAHCVVSKSPEDMRIVAGTVDLTQPNSIHSAEKIYYHDKYNASDSWVNDIALIKGDSGGPLMVHGKLVGLVSWSYHCADTVYPSVYTRVGSYIDWIKKYAV